MEIQNLIHYTVWDWLMFFYIYSFIGWVWESGYASVGQKRFVNRGFLHGPIIPIYGFGAIGILLCTMGVRENTALIFIFGMIGATALEYATGWTMEKIFHVKYWDYSNFKYNLNGYICLPASIAWGFFSVILVKVINVPIQDLVLQVKNVFTELAVLILTAATAVDVHSSVGEALDLKEMLEKLSESKEYIKRMQKRMEVVSAVRLEDYKERRAKQAKLLISQKEKFERNLAMFREIRTKQLNELLEKANSMRENTLFGNDEFRQITDGIYKQFTEMAGRRDKDFRRIAKHLKRNPTAASEKYSEALERIKELME